MRQTDRITAALLLCGAVAFSGGALRYYAYWGESGPGPAFLPFWLGLVMAALALGLLVRSIRDKKPGGAWLPRGAGGRRVLVIAAATVAFVALLKVLGMAAGSVLYLAFLMRYLGRHSWPLTAAVSVGIAAMNYLLFVHWLHVPFPEGMFWTF